MTEAADAAAPELRIDPLSGNRTIGPNGGGLPLATFLLGDVTTFKRYISPTVDAAEVHPD